MVFRYFIFTGIIFFVVAAGVSGQDALTADFRAVVERRMATGTDEDALESGKKALAGICPVDSDVVARRVFKDYGAMFIAAPDVVYPPKCIFENEEEVGEFQSGVESVTELIGGKSVTLQKAAMKALKSAIDAASAQKLSITPRGSSASRRSYSDTLRIWKSRFEPALLHWVGKKKINGEDAIRVKGMDIHEQVGSVMDWEAKGLWFSTNFDRSIFSSVAAPGTSQHLSMIALDVAEFANKDVRKILNLHGWFQTIIDDTPHFTYLGLKESDLPANGLRQEHRGGFKFWIPNFK